jgi:hypothetical protein
MPEIKRPSPCRGSQTSRTGSKIPRALWRALWENADTPAEALAAESYHPDKALDRWRSALAGDAEAMSSLLLGMRHTTDRLELLLHVARQLATMGYAPRRRRELQPVLMTALTDTWVHSGMEPLMSSLEWSLAAFVHLCDMAGGPDVSDLPERVRVYRGGGGSPRKVARGMSWTFDAATAHLFADNGVTVFGSSMIPRTGPRCVIAAEVARDAIAFRTDDRNEAEVVLRHAPRRYIVVNPPRDVSAAAT